MGEILHPQNKAAARLQGRLFILHQMLSVMAILFSEIPRIIFFFLDTRQVPAGHPLKNKFGHFHSTFVCKGNGYIDEIL